MKESQSNVVGDVHGHLLDDRVVEFLNIVQHALLIVGDQVDRHALLAIASRAADTKSRYFDWF